MLSIESVKKQAHTLKAFLNEKHKDISLASCLQAVAKINNFKDWNTMKAALDNNTENNSTSYVDDIAQQQQDLEFYVKELAKQVDNIQSKIEEHDADIMWLQGKDPYNAPD